MGRLLFFLLLGVSIYLLARRLGGNRTTAEPDRASTRMVRCHRCNTFIPESDALTAGGNNYCSRAHLEADLADADEQ